MEAWQIQKELLKKEDKQLISIQNQMLFFMLVQIGFLFMIWLIFGMEAVCFSMACGIVGFLLLESVNYIEHYGLRRKILPSGRSEKVNLTHSWNSNHELGRIFLFELTRHPDHHYKSTKKYQTLNSTKESPQLPYGYPTSILLSLIPPVWFKIMNPRIPD
jgi:alkane 1-monooxygenase